VASKYSAGSEFAAWLFGKRTEQPAKGRASRNKKARSDEQAGRIHGKWINPPTEEQLLEFVREIARLDHESATNVRKARKRVLTPRVKKREE